MSHHRTFRSPSFTSNGPELVVP
ncbi:hypothetical protein VEx25_B0331, partial [Vibrio antiquarius]